MKYVLSRGPIKPVGLLRLGNFIFTYISNPLAGLNPVEPKYKTSSLPPFQTFLQASLLSARVCTELAMAIDRV
jgi:hypothetical protein